MENNQLLMGVTATGVHVRESADGGDSRTIEGYAIVFGQESVPLWTERGIPVVETIDSGAVTRELLDGADIKMTMYHDMGRLLARSNKGKGTLSYDVDDRGVRFSFDAPRTPYGDDALEQVRLGNIDGCSFMFSTNYRSRECVERIAGEDKIRMNVKNIAGIHDFTLTPDPAYPQTECSRRSEAAAAEDQPKGEDEATPVTDPEVEAQLAEMEREAKRYY